MPNYKPLTAALEQLLTKMPAEAAATRKAFELEKEFEAAKKAAAYAPHTLPTSSGNAALNQARQTLQSAPKDSGVVDLNDVINHHIERHAKGGGVHMAVGGKASQEFPLQDMQEKKLSPLEEDTYNTFGMLPDEDRLSILPRYMKDKGFIAPQFIYDAAKAIQAPSTSLHAELSPEDAMNVALNTMGSSSVATAPRGALQMGMASKAKPTLEAERALPLDLPRAPAKTKAELMAHADRVGRQMLGEHVTSGKPKDTKNLAGRSKKESKRVQQLKYTLTPTIELPESTVYTPKIGDMNIALPGDSTVSDVVLETLNGEHIGSKQEGGSRYGLGKLDRDNPLFWASNEAPAQQFQDKVTDLAELYDPERVMGQHLAMGRTANHFAQHFADAALRSIDYSKMSANDMHNFDNVIAAGYTKKNQKTGKTEIIEFPHWPGIANPEAALEAMKTDTELRKWFLNRMKTPKVTQPTNMPNALDIEWAITHPELRNMEINLTGHSVGEMVPGAKLTDNADHNTYSKGILGRAVGHQEHLSPFVLSFPDSAQHIASTQRPQDFTGTIQKVFPHQRVDQQYIDEMGEYYRQLNKILTGKKDGGAVHMAEGGNPSQEFPLQVAPNPTEADLTPNELHPIAGGLGRALSSVHGFVSKPFGYDNPPAELASSLLGIPDIAKSLENYAYGTPNTTGSGQTLKATPELESAIMSVAPMVPAAGRQIVKGAKALAPTAAEMMLDIAEKGGTPVRMMAAPEGKAGKIKAPANDIGFYNPVEKAALNLQRKKGAGNAMLADLKKQPGVNDERLAELGLGDLATRPEITKDELIATINQNRIPLEESVKREYEVGSHGMEDAEYIAEHIKGRIESAKDELYEAHLNDDHGLAHRLEQQIKYDEEELANLDYSNGLIKGDAKFGPETHPDYNTPGGKNYREIRMKVPSNRPSINKMSRAEYNAAVEKADREGVNDFFHDSHHGDEPNVLLHLRLADHTDAEGKSGLLIDELQSDWHQAGRENGYKVNLFGQLKEFNKKISEIQQKIIDLRGQVKFPYEGQNVSTIDPKFLELQDLMRKENDLRIAKDKIHSGVPDAPFKDNWYQLGLKRAIKEAADTGMDRVYLTTGKTQNERYDLSKHVNEVHLSGSNLVAYDKNGNQVIEQTGVTKDNLADYIGKEAANKLLAQEPKGTLRSLSGVDLQVGGAGMKQYYDKNYLNYLKRYAKQHGATVGETTLSDGEKVYYMDMTPQMRESTIKGQSYKDGGAVSLDHVIHHSIKKHASKKMATGGDASQTFPLQEDKPAVARNRAGQIVYDPSEMIPGAAKSLWNTLAGTLRGRTVGAAGMAGDIMGSLNDMGTQIQDTVGSTLPARRNPAAPKPKYSLPTTEELDKMLPSAGDSQEAQVGNELGKMMPLTLDELAPAGRLIAKGAKALQPTAMDMLQMQLEKASSPTRSYAVKPKGGNWLSNSVESSTRGLKSSPLRESPEDRLIEYERRLANHPNLSPEAVARLQNQMELAKNDLAVNKWVDQKLNKYIKNEMGTPEDPIRLGIERRAEAVKEFRKTDHARLDKMAADIDRAQAAGKDTTLSEHDYEAAKEKFHEDLDVASNDLFHSPTPEEGWAENAKWASESLGDKRMEAGFPEEGMATHPAAKVWERATDTELEHYLGRNLNGGHLKGTKLLEENPWISKLKPEDKVYKLDQFATRGNLEFGHMIDEVRNAMAPDSILPKNLRISAKDLEKMTVDDISALVGKINGWRRIQKTKANLEIANNPATHTFKEYPPESNPKGLSWKQIKKPEGLPEDEAEQAVRKATEYEGSIMRHCVGGAGHCEPLLRGDVELYTLRDAKGEPHATIEVEPAEKPYPASGEEFAMLDSATKAQYGQYVREWRQRNPEINNLTDEHVYQALKEAGVPPTPPRILEIKGKLNQKPKEEYIPFIQDFVQSGDWKSVGDLHHTDLKKIDKTSGIAKSLEAAGIKNIPKYVTQTQFDDLIRWMDGKGDLPKFAGGGSVSLDHVIQRSIKKHAARRMAEGGAAYNTNPDMSDGGLFIQGSAF